MTKERTVALSVIVPAYNAAKFLDSCLAPVMQSPAWVTECIVVDDGSSDNSAAIAIKHGARLIRAEARGGSARARNLGARAATGTVLVFLDADVSANPDTFARIHSHFLNDPELDALIGAYDDAPSDPGFLSTYRNLLHCYVHRSANRRAFTFWTGCGAIRRAVLLDAGGFDESYKRPSIEDIELGYRLARAGRKMLLDPDITVKHRKHWSFFEIVRTDVCDRAVPWTELILRHGALHNDLNLRIGQRISVALAILLIPAAALAPAYTVAPFFLCLGGLIVLNFPFYRFLARRMSYAHALAAIPLHILFHFYSGIAFCAALMKHIVAPRTPAANFVACTAQSPRPQRALKTRP